jgi:hypothetical protein
MVMRFTKMFLTICTLIFLVGFLSSTVSFQDSSSPLDLIKSRLKVVPLSDRVIVLTGNLLPGDDQILYESSFSESKR